jgi:2-dehydro-3-deoxygluconokinase
MNKIFCFGELLLRMSPELNGKWIEAAHIPVYIGGAELNVATALSTWKMPVKYCTALPDNYLSQEIISHVQNKNIDTSAIQLSGNRIGTYFLPQGTDLKNAGVIYDRAHSSFSDLKPGMINWSKVLDGCTWFHFSAISPALNDNVAAVCNEALQAAAEKGITISVDLNYRSKLWQYGRQPIEVMPRLLQYCDVVMGNIWATEKLLGLSLFLDDPNETDREKLIDAAKRNMQQMKTVFPKVKNTAYTFRFDSTYFAVLNFEDELAISQTFVIENAVDKVGSGDCFMAGYVYGLMNNHQPQTIVDFAAAAATGKMMVKGDATSQTIETIKRRIINEAD